MPVQVGAWKGRGLREPPRRPYDSHSPQGEQRENKMFPHSVFPDTAHVNSQGQLVIGGCNTLDLAAEYGTPVYVLDEATLRDRCRSFIGEFQKLHPSSRVSYACKAYVNPALARIFDEEGLGLDVVSGGELAVGHQRRLPPGPGLLPRQQQVSRRAYDGRSGRHRVRGGGQLPRVRAAGPAGGGRR